mgnify:CR=1 FL=1
MRGAALLLALSSMGAPAGAGCFAADGMPVKATYQGGTTLEYMGREGDVLTYSSAGVLSRMQAGLWPLEHRGDGYLKQYRWDTPLPDLQEVIAAGGKARAEGEVSETKRKPAPVAVEVEVLGSRALGWEDCRYSVIEFRKVMTVGGKKVSEGVMLYAPDAMIAFRSDTVDLATGEVYSYALEALE